MIRGAAWVVVLAVALAPSPDVRVLACSHRHPAPGVYSRLDVAEHPRGALALMEVCNATSSAIDVPLGPSLEWEDPVPARLDGGDVDVLRLAPGRTLRFEVELTERYALRPKQYYQCRTGTSDVVGFRLRLP